MFICAEIKQVNRIDDMARFLVRYMEPGNQANRVERHSAALTNDGEPDIKAIARSMPGGARGFHVDEVDDSGSAVNRVRCYSRRDGGLITVRVKGSGFEVEGMADLARG